MLMEPVDSSLLGTMGYDAAQKKLRVTFRKNGDAYVYSGVPPGVWEALRTSRSVGSYFFANVRDSYPAEKE